MKLHSPSNLVLPALTINKSRERQAMEDDPTVHNLVRSNLLLNMEFNKLYLDILEKTKSLLELTRLTEEQLLRSAPIMQKLVRRLMHPSRLGPKIAGGVLLRYMLVHGLVSREKLEQALGDRKESIEMVFQAMKAVHTQVRKRIVKLSNEIQNRISAFEEKRNVDLHILSSTTIYFCKKCARIVSLHKFTRCTCACGERITKTSQLQAVPINHFNDVLLKFLEQNYWFEHGVDYLLRRKNLQTLVGYHVLGHSGVWHEIDNIAESKRENFRFFCECKNGEVTVNDVFVFSGKMIDVGCTRGYIFTTSDRVASEIVKLARARNIDMIKGILKRGVTSLLGEIREA